MRPRGEVEMVVRCRPWTDSAPALHSVSVDISEAQPGARVWDPIGRIYTVCHSLTVRSEARIIVLARRAKGPTP